MVLFNDDKIHFFEEAISDRENDAGVWKILIVDDEQIYKDGFK